MSAARDAQQVGHEDITTTNRIYRCVLRRKARGEIGQRRRQLFKALPSTSDSSFAALFDTAETAGTLPNKGR